ncbi:MAG: ACT domain-containing protein [Peptostreptococcaceae bacterium]
MEKIIFAELNQGIDSFLRVALTLRRKEISINSIKMFKDDNQITSIELVLDDKITPIETVVNYLNKLHDVGNIEISNNSVSSRYA